MDEYDLDGTRIFNADNASTSTLQKYQKKFRRSGKPAVLHIAVWVAFTDCANWTEYVTWYIAGPRELVHQYH